MVEAGFARFRLRTKVEIVSATQGFAAREGERGAGFDFPLPPSLSRSKKDEFVATTKNLLVTGIREAELLRMTRGHTEGPPAPRKEDIDTALGAVSNKMPHAAKGRSRLRRLLRPVLEFSYRPPAGWPEEIVAYFEEQAQRLIQMWVDEVERLHLHAPAMAPQQAIDRALYASVLRIRRENSARTAAAGRTTTEPGGRRSLAPWSQVLLTGLRLRRVWSWLRVSLVRLIGAVLTLTGGAGGLWTLAEKELSAARIDGLGPTAVALVVIGIVVMIGGGRSAS